MSKVRIIYKPDKTVSVIHYCPKSKLTEQEAFDKATPSGLPYDDIDSSQLPQSREDRNAWGGEKGKGITINQVKAQAIRDVKEREEQIQLKMRKIAERELDKEE